MIPKPRSDNNMTAGHVEGWVPLVHGFHHGTHDPAGSGDPLVSEENAGQADLRKWPHVSERLSHSPGRLPELLKYLSFFYNVCFSFAHKN